MAEAALGGAGRGSEVSQVIPQLTQVISQVTQVAFPPSQVTHEQLRAAEAALALKQDLIDHLKAEAERQRAALETIPVLQAQVGLGGPGGVPRPLTDRPKSRSMSPSGSGGIWERQGEI